MADEIGKQHGLARPLHPHKLTPLAGPGRPPACPHCPAGRGRTAGAPPARAPGAEGAPGRGRGPAPGLTRSGPKSPRPRRRRVLRLPAAAAAAAGLGGLPPPRAPPSLPPGPPAPQSRLRRPLPLPPPSLPPTPSGSRRSAAERRGPTLNGSPWQQPSGGRSLPDTARERASAERARSPGRGAGGGGAKGEGRGTHHARTRRRRPDVPPNHPRASLPPGAGLLRLTESGRTGFPARLQHAVSSNRRAAFQEGGGSGGQSSDWQEGLANGKGELKLPLARANRRQKLLGWAGPGGAGSKAVQAESSGGRSAGGGSGAPLGDLAVRK
ncbi:hypothetical protein R6Z07F_011500 [Ovis aries]